MQEAGQIWVFKVAPLTADLGLFQRGMQPSIL